MKVRIMWLAVFCRGRFSPRLQSRAVVAGIVPLLKKYFLITKLTENSGTEQLASKAIAPLVLRTIKRC
jgi:hypothetical protein